MKIGIMGGTYNPPHMGHLHAAEQAQKYLHLDRLFLIPDNIPPHKELPEGSPDALQRLTMTKIAARTISAEVSDIEIQRKGVSYTADTIDYMAQCYPNAELFFIIGTDMFLTIQNWYQPVRIFQTATLAVVAREERDAEKIATHAHALMKYGAKFQIIPCEPFAISSTELRENISNPQMQKFLPKGIWNYIVQEHLYGV